MKRGIWVAALLVVSLAATLAGAATMTVYIDSIDGGNGSTTNPVNFSLYLPVSGFTFSNFHYGPNIPASWHLSEPTIVHTADGDLFAFGSLTDGTPMPYPVPATPLDAIYPAQSPVLPAPPVGTAPIILAVFDYEGTVSSPDVSPGYRAVYGPNGNNQKKMLLVDVTSSRVDLSTLPLAGQPPVADAGPSQTVDPGASVTLDGSGSIDPDGTVDSYEWTQDGGPTVTLSDPTAVQPTFTAPAVPAMLHFRLTVADNDNLLDTATTVVSVGGPVADAGPDQTVAAGATVTLDGTGSTDPDGTIVSYEWTQTAGPAVTLSDPTVAQPTFTTPTVGASGASLAFQLTVTDAAGLTEAATVAVKVSGTGRASPSSHSGGGGGGCFIAATGEIGRPGGWAFALLVLPVLLAVFRRKS